MLCTSSYFRSLRSRPYLTLPFLYTYPGFVVRRSRRGGRRARSGGRLKAISQSVASDSREQVTYSARWRCVAVRFTVDVLGDNSSNYSAKTARSFQGIKMPTTRQVYAYDTQGKKVPNRAERST